MSIVYCRNVCMDQLNDATSVDPYPSSVYNMFVSQYLYYTHYFIFYLSLIFQLLKRTTVRKKNCKIHTFYRE